MKLADSAGLKRYVDLFFAMKSQNGTQRRSESRSRKYALLEYGRTGTGPHRMHRCPAARVTGTGCNWTPITYVHAASEMGEWKKKSKIKANEPEAKQNVEEAEERRSSALIGRTSGRNLSHYVKSRGFKSA